MALVEKNLDVRKRWRLPWYVYLLVALVLAAICAWFYPDLRAWQINRDIAASLPAGSTDAQVVAWLNGKGIPNGEINRGELGFTSYIEPSFGGPATLPPGCEHIIFARIYHVHPILQIDIVIEFFFDKNAKLISYKVGEQWTFL